MKIFNYEIIVDDSKQNSMHIVTSHEFNEKTLSALTSELYKHKKVERVSFDSENSTLNFNIKNRDYTFIGFPEEAFKAAIKGRMKVILTYLTPKKSLVKFNLI